jgi:hypothetical protein
MNTLSGTAIGVLKNRGKLHFLSQITKHKRPHNHKTRPRRSRPSGRGPRTWRPQRPTRTVSPSPLGRNSVSFEGYNNTLIELRLAQGLDAPSGETPPRSRLSWARRSPPAPPTGAFNVLTHASAQVKDESAPCRPSDAAWESYPDAVQPTLPVRPSPPLYVIVR